MTDTLAIDGGTPVRTAPLPPWPAPSEDAAEAVAEVVRSGRINYWTGLRGKAFEEQYAFSLGRAHAIALANGTVALELALRAFGIGQGDEVVVPARTFVATAGAVVAVGATPVIADVDRDSGTLTAHTVEAVLTARTKAVIPVHLGGWPVDMDPLIALARARGLIVIEDAAQAHGGVYRGRPVGALGSQAAAFSFCNDKILSTGEGGMLALDDDDAYARAWAYKDHGKSLALVNGSAADEDTGAFRWLIEDFGTNWRMPEVCAPLGLDGLRHLADWHDARTRNALRLAEALRRLPGLRVPLPAGGVESAFYRLYAYVVPEALAPGWDRDRITRALSAEGIPGLSGSCGEIYREKAFSKQGFGPAAPLPVAAELATTSLAFLVHPTMTDAAIDDTAAAMAKVMAVAAR
jgi:hypothetical protein